LLFLQDLAGGDAGFGKAKKKPTGQDPVAVGRSKIAPLALWVAGLNLKIIE
jgi:hypothetical protein